MQEKTEKLVTDLVPDGWFCRREGSSIFTSAYRTLRANPEYFARILPLHLLGTYVVPVEGELTYIDLGETNFQIDDDGNFQVHQGVVRHATTPEGQYLLILTPLDVDGSPGVEVDARERVKSAIGYLASAFGRNIAYKRIYENVISLEENKYSTYGPCIENPYFFGPPNIYNVNRESLISAGDKIGALEHNDKERLRLACRWYEEAIRSTGVDAFLKCWFALETLGMPDTNVRSINQSLGRGYGINDKAAADKFQVGRLFGLRSRIVHQGEVVSLHSTLELYVEAIFRDVATDFLGLQCERRAELVMARPDFDLRALLQER